MPLVLVVGQDLGFCKDIYRNHVHLSPSTWRHFDCNDTILTCAFYSILGFEILYLVTVGRCV